MEENFKRKPITDEDIEKFLNGRDPEEGIVNIEYSYNDNFVKVYVRDKNDKKTCIKRDFYPFVWAKRETCEQLKRNAAQLASQGKLVLEERGRTYIAKDLSGLMKQYGIWVEKLETKNNEGVSIKDLEEGFTFLFFAKIPMSNARFSRFFDFLGLPLRDDDDKKKKPSSSDIPYLTISPQEQYLIGTGKRFFKGFDDYNDILRMIFDLETTGLDTKKDKIEQFGIRFNRPFKYKGKEITFERILTVEGNTEEERAASELECIKTAFSIIKEFKPDVITAHNGEAFDWNMIIGALERLGTSIYDVSKEYFNGETIRKSKKPTILKLGGEVETFFQTNVPGTIITDSLHAVRRAQAVDSNFAKGTLKYAIKYLNLQKSNRVYVPGNKITNVWNDLEERYAFKDENGDWYQYDPENGKEYTFNGETKRNYIPVYNTIEDGYVLKSGRYIVQRYLLDDLWECDKVELSLNQSAFNICKCLPLVFRKCCTMGTAGQWKSLMLAWSFENKLAIPRSEDTGSFTGGLSRLLCVGASGPGLVKFDYNSLYPSIIGTWGIEDEKDIMGVTLKFLLYFLTSRETFKGKKKEADKLIEKYEAKINDGKKLTQKEEADYNKALKDFSIADNLQMVRKVFCNSFFGSYGSRNGSVYPWKSVKCAERTTCTGRQSLRLMISHFKKLGYQPIVGDSFTGDTPLFIKYKESGLINIVPIEELIDEDKIEMDALGREYDYSKKNYLVLCRSGWVEPNYIYRHNTNKEIYEITDGDMKVNVTEDHSLYNSDKNKIKPCDITSSTKLEYFEDLKQICNEKLEIDDKSTYKLCDSLIKGEIDRIPLIILNGKIDIKKKFYDYFIEKNEVNAKYSKTCLSGLLFLKKCILQETGKMN